MRGCGQFAGNDAGMAIDKGGAFESRLVGRALAAPSFKCLNIGTGRLARLEVNDPRDRLIEQRFGLERFRWQRHNYRPFAQAAVIAFRNGRRSCRIQ